MEEAKEGSKELGIKAEGAHRRLMGRKKKEGERGEEGQKEKRE